MTLPPGLDPHAPSRRTRTLPAPGRTEPHRGRRDLLSILLAATAALATLGGIGLATERSSRPAPESAAAARPAVGERAVRTWQAPRRYTPPRRTILATDPNRHPHGISRTLARYVDSVPTGGRIRVETYFLGSSLTHPALVRAFRRGVDVQVVLNGSTRDRFPQGERLARLLDRDRRDDSWVVFTERSARGSDAVRSIDHNKIWRFSRVGDRRWVTVVGSYNNSDTADRHAYGLMWSVADRQVYRAFDRVFRESARDRPVAGNPMRQYDGAGWTAYFLPSTAQTPAADPVMQRLAAIPAGPETRIRIAMFTMWDSRGEWIAERLAALARQGTRITFVAGPLVGRIPLDTMTWGGVDIEGGCWPEERTYVHGKDMSASWIEDGERRHWTWIGSDNWTSHTLRSDQAVLGIEGRRWHRQFVEHFRALTARPDHIGYPCDAMVADLAGRG